MAGLLAPYEYRLYPSALGVPVAHGRLYTYQAGTLELAPTYTTAALSVPNPNPMTFTAGGVSVPIFLDQGRAYKFVVTDADGVVFETQDHITFIPPLETTDNWILTIETASPTGTLTPYTLATVQVYPSYWQWAGGSATTLNGIAPFGFLADPADSPFLLFQNLSPTTLFTMADQSVAAGAAKLFLRAGQTTPIQLQQWVLLLLDGSSPLSHPGWWTQPVYSPSAPTRNLGLSSGVTYLTTTEPVGIGDNPTTGQVTVLVTQTNAGDAGGTIKVLSDTSNPPTTVRAYQAYGPGATTVTVTVDVLAGERFLATLTGSSTQRTTVIGWLGGDLI